MTTQIQPYKITASEVATIIPLIIGIMLVHIGIIAWVVYSLSRTGTSQIRELLAKNKLI